MTAHKVPANGPAAVALESVTMSYRARDGTGSAKTVLFVTHDLDEAVSLSDEVVLLSAGPASRIVGSYPVDLPRPRDLLDIRTNPEFTEIYRAIWSDLRDEVMKVHDHATVSALHRDVQHPGATP